MAREQKWQRLLVNSPVLSIASALAPGVKCSWTETMKSKECKWCKFKLPNNRQNLTKFYFYFKLQENLFFLRNAILEANYLIKELIKKTNLNFLTKFKKRVRKVKILNNQWSINSCRNYSLVVIQKFSPNRSSCEYLLYASLIFHQLHLAHTHFDNSSLAENP